MILLLGVVAVAAVTGLLLGRTFAGFPDVSLGWPALAVVGLALQLLPVGDDLAYVALMLSFGMLLAFAIVNLRAPGFLLLAVGLALNLVAIGWNGGMPVTVEALRDAGQIHSLDDLADDGVKHRLADEHTVLVPLVDAIGLPPPVGDVVSVGDLCMYLGVGWFVVAGMPERRQRLSARA